MRLTHPAFSQQFLPRNNTAQIVIGAWPEKPCSHMMAVPDKNPLTTNWQKLAGLNVIARLEYPLSKETLIRLTRLWRKQGALDIYFLSQGKPLLIALTEVTQNTVKELRDVMKEVRYG